MQTRQRTLVEEVSAVIVVGVDGSPAGDAALRFAVEEAGRKGVRVRAVCVYSAVTVYPVAPVGMGAAAITIPVASPEERAALRRAAEAAARTTIEEALSRCGANAPEGTVDVAPIEGDPGDTLVNESRHAELLVVGSHGHRALTELLLGSATHHCIQHASCPVVVIPPGLVRR